MGRPNKESRRNSGRREPGESALPGDLTLWFREQAGRMTFGLDARRSRAGDDLWAPKTELALSRLRELLGAPSFLSRTYAAVGLASSEPQNPKTAAKIRETLVTALRASDEAVRRVAAWGLLVAGYPDLGEILDDALLDPASADAAVTAFLRLFHASRQRGVRHRPEEQYLPRNLGAVLRDPSVPLRVKTQAYDLHSWREIPVKLADVLAYLRALAYHASDYRERCDAERVGTEVLRAGDPEAARCVRDLIADATADRDVRTNLLGVAAINGRAIFQEFLDFFPTPAEQPDVIAMLLDLQSVWSVYDFPRPDLLPIIGCEALPFAVRVRGFEMAWRYQRGLLDRRGFEVLFSDPRYADVRAAALESCRGPNHFWSDPFFDGVDPDIADRVIAYLAPLADPTTPADSPVNQQRATLLGLLNYDHVPAPLRERVRELLGKIAERVALTDATLNFDLLNHALHRAARRSGRLTHDLFVSPGISLAAKYVFLRDEGIPAALQDFPALLRSALTESERKLVAHGIWQRMIRPRWYNHQWARYPEVATALLDAAREGGPIWEELVATPELLGRITPKLAAIALDPRRPLLVRQLAGVRIRQGSHSDTTLTRERRAMRALVRGGFADPALPPEILALVDGTAYLLAAADRLTIAADTTLPSEKRIRLLQLSAPDHDSAAGIALLIAFTHPGEPRAVRVAALEALQQRGCFKNSDDLAAWASAILNAPPGADLEPAFHRLWEALHEVQSVLTKPDAFHLDRALDPNVPVPIRAFLLGSLAKRPRALPVTVAGRLWRACSRETHPELRSRLYRVLRNLCGDLPADAKDLDRPFWKAVGALWQLPDAQLVQAVLRRSLYQLNQRATRQFGDAMITWLSALTPRLPEESWLPIFQLSDGNRQLVRRARLVSAAYQRVRRHHTATTELSRALLHSLDLAPENLALVREILDRSYLDTTASDRADHDARSLVVLLRNLISLQGQPDLTDWLSEAASSAPKRVSEWEMTVRKRLLRAYSSFLPGADPDALERVSQQTLAPLILAHKYQFRYPTSLPLLGAAINAAAREESWQSFRYDRPEASAQLGAFSAEDVQVWRENRALRVPYERPVPSDVRVGAQKIRDIARTALRAGEIPSEVAALIADAARDEAVAVQRATAFHAACARLGKVSVGEPATVTERELTGLPDHVRSAVIQAIQGRDAARARLLHERFSRADEVLQLLFCDERSLARNTLRADFGTRSRGTALATAQRLVYNFRHRGRRGGAALPSPFADDLEQVATLLRNLSLARSPESYLLREHDDFRTLIEIGHVPYAQGSCQDYASDHPMNRGLLSYVVDATTKALVLYRPDGSGEPVARAIVRLGAALDGDTPVLVLEPTYAFAREIDRYAPSLQRGAIALASARNWRLGVPDPRGACLVKIPASQNTCQYEDGYPAVVAKATNGMLSGPYTLRLRILPAATTIEPGT